MYSFSYKLIVCCAVIAFALSFSLLIHAEQKPIPGTSAPLYAVIQAKLFKLTETAVHVADFPCIVNQHSFAALTMQGSEHFIYWYSAKQKLFLTTSKLVPIKDFTLSGSAVWIYRDTLVSVSKNWDNGFVYTLYKLKDFKNLVMLASWKLDLFLSDCLISPQGILIAGSSNDDRFSYVYWCAPGQKAVELFKQPREKAFLRLVDADNGAYLYASAQNKTRQQLTVWFLPYQNNQFLPASQIQIMNTSSLLCWYGSGFFYKGSLYLPAFNGTNIVIAQFRQNNQALEPIKSFDNAYGVYTPIGVFKNYCWFISYDYYTNPSQWSLSFLDLASLKIVHNFIKTP